MADVTEIVHSISYEVNDSALQNATKAIQMQIMELDRLGKVLNGYSAQLAQLSGKQSEVLDELSNKIEVTNRKIAISSAKAESVLKQTFMT